MKLKPLNDVSEHDCVNGLFAYRDATGAQGTLVVIDGSGWNNSQGMYADSNLADTSKFPNVYSPRWAWRARVRPAVSGEKPFGFLRYDVREANQDNISLLRREQDRVALQAVVSGQPVPILRKGLFLVGPFGTGETPAAGKFAVVKGTGDWGVSTTYATGVFGEYIGTKDSDGYAGVIINCYV